jgi:hypothetical protein
VAIQVRMGNGIDVKDGQRLNVEGSVRPSAVSARGAEGCITNTLRSTWLSGLGPPVAPASLWNDFKRSGGAMNLFDTERSFAQVGGTSDFDFSQDELKARTYYLRSREDFSNSS